MEHRNGWYWAVALAVALAVGVAGLVGCGGGGDGGSGPPAVPLIPSAPTTAVTITPGNAGGLTAEALDAGTAGAAGGGATLLTGVEVQPSADGTVAAWRRLSGLMRKAAAQGSSSAVVGVVVNRSLSCTGGGSIAVAGNQAVSGSATAGDSLQLTFNNCREAEIGLVTGGMTLTFGQVSADLSFFVADSSLINLTVTSGSRGDRLSGSLRVGVDDRSTSQTVVDASSASLTYSRLVNGSVRSQRTLTDYTYRGVTTRSNGQTAETFSYAASGSFPSLGSNVAWSAATTQPLITLSGATRPTAGAGRIVGANGKSIAITVTSSGLRLDIDHSGDSGIDTTSDLTWVQFEALL